MISNLVNQGCRFTPRTHRAAAQPSSSFAFPHKPRFYRFSCDVRPVGRGLTFVPGDVSTRIRIITVRRSLLPTSQSRIAIGPSCDRLSPKGERYGVSTFRLSSNVGVGVCNRPRGVWVTRMKRLIIAPASCTFWSSVMATSACSIITVFNADSDVFTIPTI
jgi:hypothetical protein